MHKVRSGRLRAASEHRIGPIDARLAAAARGVGRQGGSTEGSTVVAQARDTRRTSKSVELLFRPHATGAISARRVSKAGMHMRMS